MELGQRRAGAGCLAWAPDGRRLVAFGAGGHSSFVVGLDGTATTLDERQTEEYQQSSGRITIPLPGQTVAEPTGTIYPVSSEVTCPRWLNATRLAFDRVAEMPAGVQVEKGERPEPVEADTTTLAIVTSGSAQLVDSATRWHVYDACGGRLITGPGAGDGNELFVVDAATLVDGDLAAAALPAAGALERPTPEGSYGAGFVPGSCDIVMVVEAASGALHPAERRDAQTGAVRDLAPVFADSGRTPIAAREAVVGRPAPPPRCSPPAPATSPSTCTTSTAAGSPNSTSPRADR